MSRHQRIRVLFDSENALITHHALGFASYNASTDQYKFASYLSDGHHTDAWFKVLEQNKFQWGFNTPQGMIRYNIVMNAWKELG